MDREILVSLDLHGAVAFVGRLWCRTRRGRHSASFEYDPGWLAHPERFALEPALMLASGPFHTAPGRSLFGAVGDSMPDRWGRLLMRRAEPRTSDIPAVESSTRFATPGLTWEMPAELGWAVALQRRQELADALEGAMVQVPIALEGSHAHGYVRKRLRGEPRVGSRLVATLQALA